MKFKLVPTDDKFFDLFCEVAENAAQSARGLQDLLQHFDDLPERHQRIIECEQRGDALTDQILSRLNTTFITPFDREDIHNLATSLDDIMDSLEETAHRFEVFRIEAPTRASIQLASIISEACQHLEHAIRLLRNMNKPEDIHAHILEVSRLENEADRLYREVDAALFDNTTPQDVLTLIKWRELYGWLEETVDSCKDVANHISEIVIKGS